MITKNYLCAKAIELKSCLVTKAVDYIDHVVIGHEDEAESVWNEFELVDSVLFSVENHNANVWIDPDKVHLKPGSKFLNSRTNKVSLDGKIIPDKSVINCLTDEDICDRVNKITSICNCHG